MAEYIDREKFLKRLGEEYPGIPPHGAIVVGMLCDEEPADVRPVVRGHWEIQVVGIDGEDVYCSTCECGGAMPYWPFCPMCGADMREETIVEAEGEEEGSRE